MNGYSAVGESLWQAAPRRSRKDTVSMDALEKLRHVRKQRLEADAERAKQAAAQAQLEQLSPQERRELHVQKTRRQLHAHLKQFAGQPLDSGHKVAVTQLGDSICLGDDGAPGAMPILCATFDGLFHLEIYRPARGPDVRFQVEKLEFRTIEELVNAVVEELAKR
jgi:hypothetical protein